MRLLSLVVALVLLLVAGRLVQVQLLESGGYARQASHQLSTVVSVPALRGGIYDRNGAVLALSVPTQTVVADDFQIAHPGAEAATLSPLLGVPASALSGELHRPSGYVPLVHHLSVGQADKVMAARLPGITTLDDARRVVPNGQLGASVLGGTYASGAGSSGLEYEYQGQLAGRAGSERLLEAPSGVALPTSAAVTGQRSVAGTGLELTLDDPLQYQTEQALGSEISATHATGGTAVVMDVHTGQVLSMANLTTASDGSVHQAQSNLALTQTYEPGSVFKVVTFSAALDRGLVTPSTTFSVPDQISLDGQTFNDAETHPVENLTASDILAQSSNIGTSEIAQRVGESGLLAQVQRLGFGVRTDLHFPGESAGVLATPAQWNPTDLVDLPIGQVDGVTAQQVLDMVNSVAAGGVMVEPKLVRATIDGQGTPKATAPSAKHRVMSPATAGALSGMLQQVVTSGTGTSAAIPGYTVAGKTGTAEIPDPTHGGYLPNAYMASFVGYAPADHPVLSMIVVLDQPTPIYGGTVAAPVFSQVMSYALHRYAIPSSAGAPTTPTPPPGTSQTQDVT